MGRLPPNHSLPLWAGHLPGGTLAHPNQLSSRAKRGIFPRPCNPDAGLKERSLASLRLPYANALTFGGRTLLLQLAAVAAHVVVDLDLAADDVGLGLLDLGLDRVADQPGVVLVERP